jgi:hypothetical protein
MRKGQFVKGADPRRNPGGRPKIPSEFKQKCRDFTREQLFDAWSQEVLERGEHWMKAAELIAAYGEGKPPQAVEHTGADGEALSVSVIVEPVDPPPNDAER